MKRLFPILLACVLSGTAFAQEVFLLPDYEGIQNMGQAQYDSLLNRFQAQDTTLSIVDLQAVYYGSAFYGNPSKGLNNKRLNAITETKGNEDAILYVDSVLATSPLKATRNELDSLYLFCEQIGEDSANISQIMNSPDAAIPSFIIDNYLSLLRLGYDYNQKQYEWYPGWGDSLYVCKYVNYITHQIVQDTALSLIEDYLENAYLFLFHHEYAVRRLLDCAEYSIVRFHSRSGYLIPELCYLGKETNDWQEKLQFYEMTKFVILSPKHFRFRYFAKDINMKFDSIIAESNESSPYYSQFRSMLDSYSDIDLARISKWQEAELVNILLQGIANGEKKSQLTYAFMLMTGQFVEKDQALGNELLRKLLE